MNADEVFSEIREVNLAYLMLAQRLARRNPVEAQVRLGMSAELTAIIGGLSAAQIVRLADSDVLLCGVGLQERSMLSALNETLSRHDMQTIHAAMLLAQLPARTL
ncbi:flagellar transcriptional regulator FlhD [Paraburkholderia terrae]|uniref:flagellar transcriptional regulator FlhD n=1 Tax=Paraburkholderia terrae TaxID=311230 RepID=UPI00296AD56C|nr:flagellar transcriptional regulator FlhD [Paraburkholderia terrae]MDW3662487.1 flagellar transcriptional regulator FlhD [Paraburkholderia terrae]